MGAFPLLRRHVERQERSLKEYERQLDDTERCLADEQIKVEGLRSKLSEKTECLQVEVHRLSLSVDDLHQQLNALKVEFAKLQTHAVTAEQRVIVVAQELAKRLGRAVRDYKGSASFDRDAAQACCSTFMVVYSSIEQDLQRYFPDFDVARFQCMTSCLEMRLLEKEADYDCERQSDAYPPRPKGAPPAEGGEPSLPEGERLSTPFPNEHAAPPAQE